MILQAQKLEMNTKKINTTHFSHIIFSMMQIEVTEQCISSKEIGDSKIID